MSQNIGTLITSPIRPNDSLDLIASAFGNEIKGGHHGYATLAERNSIITARREWGMLVSVYNDSPSNNKTYQLKYNYVNTTITDNSNWVEFSGSVGGSGTEWIDSVYSVLGTPPVSPTIGDRYLLSSIPTGIWASNPNQVAEWISASAWSYTIPKDGTSLRVDNDDNSVYRWEGIYPSPGMWVREAVNQVRFISASSSLGFTYSSNPSPSIGTYMTEMLYLTTFGITNSASASLNINGLGLRDIKKLSGAGLTDIAGGDLTPGVVYSLTYDGTYFQINIPSGATSVGVIGAAEDGDYTDGLFTDFNPSTPIGTPIDRFNEILKSLVPPSAPILSDWSGSKSGSVNGKLSFDDANPISGYVSATNSTISSVAVDGSWTISGKRLGIAASASNNVSGVLNSQVTIHNGSPTPAYVAASFGDANLGQLKIYVNGTLKVSSTITLTNLSAQDTTSGGVNTGFNISSATSSKFPQGDPFTTFLNRTGTWNLRGDDADIVLGYNYVNVVHDNAPSFTRILNRYEFVIDHNTTPTSFGSGVINTYTLSGNKPLSGIRYFTGGTLRYGVSINNLYRNTYYAGSDAITFNDTSTGGTIPLLNVSQTMTLAPSLGDEGKTFSIINSDQNGSYLTFSVLSSGKRRLNESISMNTGAKRTVQGNSTGGAVSISNIYLDNVSASSTLTYEGFDDEFYRLKNTSGPFQYDTYGVFPSNVWDSNQSLVGGTAGWTDGLQVYNGTLVYPTINFSSPGSLLTNLNFGSALSNYSSASGNRVYIRYFRQVAPTTGNFVVIMNGTGTFVPVLTALSGNNIHFEIKAPGLVSSETGWLDAYNDFATATWVDGSGGRNAAAGVGRAFGVNWGLTIGTKSTANTSGYMLIRITVGPTFTGNIDSINWTFA